MDSLIWHKGRKLKSFIEHGTKGQVAIPDLAVAMILTANEQGLTMDQIVQQLILANEYDAAANRLSKDQSLRDLGY